jgi:hypothetical protein
MLLPVFIAVYSVCKGDMQVPEASEDFWESLEISVRETIEERGKPKADLYKWLKSKLTNQSKFWYSTICQTFQVMGPSLTEVISRLDTASPGDFANLVGLAIFADRNINQKIVFDVCRSRLDQDWVERINKGEIDSVAVLLPMFRLDRELLKLVYYEHLVQFSEMHPFVLGPKLGSRLDFSLLDSNQVSNFLTAFEESLPERQRKETMLWWFDSAPDRMRIVFRREKKLSSIVKTVRKNRFLKGSDEKILVFSEGGNKLSLASKRQPGATLRIAEFIIRGLSRVEASYEPVINELTAERFGEFMNRLRSSKIPNAALVSLTIRNAPLLGSPLMEVNCFDADVTPALGDLLDHGIDVTSNPSDIVKFGVRVFGRSYTIHTSIDDEVVTLSVDNRYLREEEKVRIEQFMIDQVGQV